nr:hypothetical protein [Endozoicomonas sp.]
MSATRIDVPFDMRHKCWYCGEPSYDDIEISHQNIDATVSDSTSLLIPVCEECEKILHRFLGKSVYDGHQFVKNELIKTYSKHLAVGSKWTEKELMESEFQGSALEGFGRSAWAMFEIAKERLTFKSWPLSIDEMPIDQPSDAYDNFEYDGIRFANLGSAVDYYSKIFELSKPYLRSAVNIVGKDRFTFAVRYCRLNPGISDEERDEYLGDLQYSIDEENELR